MKKGLIISFILIFVFGLNVSAKKKIDFGKRFISRLEGRTLVVQIMNSCNIDSLIPKNIKEKKVEKNRKFLIKEKHAFYFTQAAYRYNRFVKRYFDTALWHHNKKIIFLTAQQIRGLKNKEDYAVLSLSGLRELQHLASNYYYRNIAIYGVKIFFAEEIVDFDGAIGTPEYYERKVGAIPYEKMGSIYYFTLPMIGNSELSYAGIYAGLKMINKHIALLKSHPDKTEFNNGEYLDDRFNQVIPKSKFEIDIKVVYPKYYSIQSELSKQVKKNFKEAQDSNNYFPEIKRNKPNTLNLMMMPVRLKGEGGYTLVKRHVLLDYNTGVVHFFIDTRRNESQKLYKYIFEWVAKKMN